MSICTIGTSTSSVLKCLYSQNIYRNVHHSCKILVIGGGTGGCTMAAKFSRKFKDTPNHVIIIEPSEVHYYQPLFTLIGGGLSSFEKSHKPMAKVLPKNAKWIRDSVIAFAPERNSVTTSNGDTVRYEIMIIAMGLQLYWDQTPGLVEGLRNPDSQVCSIYGPDTVVDAFRKIKKTQSGTAVFTFPNSPVKCPGAPQKIAYIAEDYWRRNNVRSNIDVVYNTSLPVIFGVKKYADALWNVCKKRDIHVNLRTNLVEINPEAREAVFISLDKSGKKTIQKNALKSTIKQTGNQNWYAVYLQCAIACSMMTNLCTYTDGCIEYFFVMKNRWCTSYTLLHVCPNMGPPEVLQKHQNLTNEAGFVCVNPKTLQHDKYSNIYGIGDCTNTPNSKTMAAISAQSKVLYKNILDDLAGKSMSEAYDGYASCPLVTGYGKCILAEFDYELKPLETFPVNQDKEYYAAYLLKKTFFPFLYWNLMLNGHWNGPGVYRKYLNIFRKRNNDLEKDVKN